MSRVPSKALELLLRGQENLGKKSAAEEKTKVGTLRAGNAGILMSDGRYAGACPALTWLRFRGVSSDKGPDASRELMFEAGRVNEDAWDNALRASGYKGRILRETEVPISWTTSNGTKVTGRPDMVLEDENGMRELGIEHKLVSSMWTARSVLLNAAPKLANVVQAAHYSWKLDVPFELWYTCRNIYETKADFTLKAYPNLGAPLSEFFEYRYTEGNKSITEEEFHSSIRKGKKNVYAVPAKYRPFVAGFRLQYDKRGRLWYTPIDRDGAQATLSIVSQDGINGFYESVSTLKAVPAEPATLKPTGKPESFQLSSFCSLGKLCCKYQAGSPVGEWEDRVKEIQGVLGTEEVNQEKVQDGVETVRVNKAKSRNKKQGE